MSLKKATIPHLSTMPIKKFSHFFIIGVLTYACSSYSLLDADTNTKQNKQELFIEKYIKKDSKAFVSGKEVQTNKYRKQLSEKINIDAIATQDINNTSYQIDYNNSIHNKTSKNIANMIKTNIDTNKYQKKINDYEKYILEDKQLNFKQQIENYNSYIDSQPKQNNTVNYQNQYLAKDERLIIAISSSIPTNTVHNYFDSLSEVYSDVLFVLNGFIGNNPKYVMPTFNYISELLTKRNATKFSKKNKYFFRVDIYNAPKNQDNLIA